MVSVILSRFLGLVRDRLLATYFGAGPELGAFQAAAEIPDTIFYLLGSAVFSFGLVPLFSFYWGKEKKEKAWDMASSLLNLSLCFFLVFAGLLFFFAPSVSALVAPGFTSHQIHLMAGLLRVMVLAQIFFVFSYFLTSVLHSQRRFLVPALSPLVYNLGIILGIILLSSRRGIYGPAWGMVLGAFLHFVVQLPLALSLGLRENLGFKIHLSQAKKALRLSAPRALTLVGGKLGTLYSITLASLLPILDKVSNVAVLYYARHLEAIPVSLFGLTVAQAAFPSLSLARGKREKEKFKTLISSSLERIFYFALPASFLLLALRVPLVRLAFGAQRFPWKATILTSKILAALFLGILARSAIPLLTRAFYALGEGRKAAQVSLSSTALAALLGAVFTRLLHLGASSLGWAFSLAYVFEFVFLSFLLRRKTGLSFPLRSFLKKGVSALASGGAAYLSMKVLDLWVLDTTRTLPLLLLTFVSAGLGILVYLFFTWIFKIKETLSLFETLRRIRKEGKRFLNPSG